MLDKDRNRTKRLYNGDRAVSMSHFDYNLIIITYNTFIHQFLFIFHFLELNMLYWIYHILQMICISMCMYDKSFFLFLLLFDHYGKYQNR